MRRLKLVGLSADGRQVVFVDDAGAEFSTPADDRLRAALRGDRARLGQLEIEMDSALRPRDIQARIRAGDTPETVAALAQVSVERIMPYAVPVLAERQHIAELARRSHVRRKGTDGPSRGLADVVAERLQGRGVDAMAAVWDAWRREDGRWAVQASYHSGERERSALFIYDAVGRYSLADDDEAKWLTGERQSTSKGPQPREAGRGGERRLSAVPDGDDLLSLSDDEGDDELSDDLTAVVRAVRETPRETPAEVKLETPLEDDEPDDGDPAEEPAESEEPPAVGFLDTVLREPTRRDSTPSDSTPSDSSPSDATPADATPATDEPPIEPTPEPKKRKRASVPSWDEIMFGKDDT
jgi:hypothetical protein